MNGFGNQGETAMTRDYDSPKSLRQVTFKEQIENNMKHHEAEAAKCKEMLQLLEENPAIARFMELSR